MFGTAFYRGMEAVVINATALLVTLIGASFAHHLGDHLLKCLIRAN